MEFLSTKFVMDYVNNNPKPLTEIGEFVYYRTYSRWLPKRGRREYWHETIKRSIEYNMALEYKHMRDLGMKIDLKRMKKEAKKLFVNIYNTKQFPSGRTLWIGNANEKVNENFVLGNFNCSFLNISNWDDLGDLFYLLLVGTGVGFKSTRKLVKGMDKIRVNTRIVNKPYEGVLKPFRLEHTELEFDDEKGIAIITVGDSKEGWVEALREYFTVLTKAEHEHIHTIMINYDNVRPRGERLMTFGGTASGHEPLMEMFSGIDKVFKNEIDYHLAPLEVDEKGYAQVRPVHILDIGNLVGAGVVVGGVRRTAEIFLCDSDDWEVILAKYGINGIWDTMDPMDPTKVLVTAEEKHGEVVNAIADVVGEAPEWLVNLPLRDGKARQLNHRRMSNNSVAFEKKPTRKMLHLMYVIMKNEGEPGFVNLEEARRRRPNAEGLNPCVEIILDSYGVCNLTTINVTQFIIDNGDGTYSLDLEGIKEAQELSTRIGLRMCLAELELPHWNAIQQRDMLVGTSLTGWKDAMSILGFDSEQEVELMGILKETSRTAADEYARELRVPTPLLATTVKPEGTLSQVARNPITNSPVSNGLHVSHAPYYIRRIRINSNDPLALVAKELGWTIHAEVGTNGELDPAKLASEEMLAAARTWVIDFPIASGATKTKEDVGVKEQFETYFNFMSNYVEHNASNTIHVRPEEWGEAEQLVWDGWDNFVGVSFLAEDGGSYTLAPYETITEEKYHELKAKMQLFDPSLLHNFEESETEADMENMDSCESGICPIR